MDPRLDPVMLRAAWWTARSLRRARRQLRAGAFADLCLPPPPDLPDGAFRGVRAVLRRASPTCLERALVLQRWFAAHGSSRDVVIGVMAAAEGFAAHAWLDGEHEAGQYSELTRLPA
jgi:hypothetical protein